MTKQTSGRLLVAALTALLAAPLPGAVEGRVTTEDGRNIEGVVVQTAGARAATVTDARGRFRLEGVDPPVTVLLEHPRFTTLEVEVAEDGATLTLQPKQEVFEDVVVTARPDPLDALETLSAAATSVSPDEEAAPPSSVVALVEDVPGVAMSGQGGLFQAYSIRGVAGQRVRTSIGGARIVTERRAGSTASFVDPLLVSSAEAVRGPASTYHSSGALGGALQILPRRYEGTDVTLGWSDQGDERYARAGWGDGRWSLGVAGRKAGDSETPDGELLPSHFEQWSASVQRRWDPSDDLAVDLLVLPSVSRDIGKPNTRFPDRITQYPIEDHLVVRVRARHRDGWSLEGFAHPNALETENLRATSYSLVESESFDFGFTGQGELTLASGWTTLFGLEYFGRQRVRADERFDDFESGEEERMRTLDGSEHEVSLFATGRRGVGRATFELGARATGLQQANRGAPTTDDTSGSLFAGVTVPVPGGIELVANVGTGIRFPGLSERFFTGTTGRGEILANEDLDPERSLGLDVGVRFYGRRTYVAGYLFRNEIDDYIEQVELEPGIETFVNLTSGTIEGAEVEGSFMVSSRWTLGWTGTVAEGRSAATEPLADVPADRVAGRVAFSEGPWSARARWEHRFEKDDPGPSEQETGSAELLSASVGRDLAKGLSLRLYGTNLLDETYLPTADDLAVPAQGRSVGVAVSWKS